jgi:ATP-dependent DNA ligase
MATLIVTLPTLYSRNKAGKLISWVAKCYRNADGTAYSHVSWGLEDGKQQTAVISYLEGKNIGRKNETTAADQCVAETKSKWQAKKDKENYSESREGNVREERFPMLAHTFDPLKPSCGIVFPCYVQPKLDGLRCIIYENSAGEIIAQSRTAGIFTSMGHITAALEPVIKANKGLVLDGELFTDKEPFEDLVGVIKKQKLTPEYAARALKVEYHVYDIIVSGIDYAHRLSTLRALELDALAPIRLVETKRVPDMAGFRAEARRFIEAGYEGAMLRNVHGLYVQDRSYDLQKYKEFKEDEFEVIGYSEGQGRDAGAVIWRCRTADGGEFDVRPTGSIEQRRKDLLTAKGQIGKQYTVVYQELTEKGIPRFPTGKAFREGY